VDVNEDTLWKRSGELVTEFYGEGSPVSEEEIGVLVVGLQRERHSLARELAEASELSGFSPAELIEKLEIDIRGPSAYEPFVREFCFACERLHEKGYGPEIQRLLTTDGLFGRQGDEPFPSLMSLIRSRDISKARDFAFNLPRATA